MATAKPKSSQPLDPAVITGGSPRNRALRSQGRFARLPALIWEARQRAGLTPTALARELGVSSSAVYAWESHERIPTPPQRVRLAEFLKIGTAALDLFCAGNRIDVVFRRGAATPEALHQAVVEAIEEVADLRGVSS
jgi:transcriptional regulator with XRE-family HTH domain